MTQPKGVHLALLSICGGVLLAAGGCQVLKQIGQRHPAESRQPAAESTAPAKAPARQSPASAPAQQKAIAEPTAPPPPAHTEADAFQALRQAGIKPLDPGSLDYYMDVQEAKLHQQLRRTAVSVVRDGNAIVVTLPVSVTFESGKTDVSPGFYDALNSVTLVLKEYDRTIVRLDGYTDSSGGAALNRSLSQRRARAVADYFVRQGIRRPRLVVKGHGEADPVASNATAEGRERNRRVELRIIPLATV